VGEWRLLVIGTTVQIVAESLAEVIARRR